MKTRVATWAAAAALLGFACGLGAQDSTPPPGAPPASATAPSIAKDPIEGTRWLGTLTSPTGPTQLGLEFQRSPRGTLYLLEYLPVMHIFSQPTSRVTPHGDEYVLNDLPGTARVDGNRLKGVALYAKMPFELERVDNFPAPPDQSPATLPEAPAPLWSRALGAAAWAGPAIRDGVLYLGTTDGRFHAVRASDGRELWTWSDPTPIYGDALVTGDAVFFVNDRTELVRLDRKTGLLRWRVALDPARRSAVKIPDDDTYNHRTATPVIAGGVLYIGSTDGGVFALDPATGSTQWRIDVGARVGAPVAVDGDRLWVGTMDGGLFALRRRDGGEIWRQKLVAAITPAPCVHGGRVVVGGRDYLLHAYDAADGREVWSQHFWASWVESTPRVDAGVLYVGSSDLRAVRALDPSTGRVLWSTDVFGAAWASPVVTKNAVYIGVAGVQGYLIDERPSIVALDRKTGAIRWRTAQPQPAAAQSAIASSAADLQTSGYPGPLAFANNVLYAAGLDGTLLAMPAR